MEGVFKSWFLNAPELLHGGLIIGILRYFKALLIKLFSIVSNACSKSAKKQYPRNVIFISIVSDVAKQSNVFSKISAFQI